MWLGVPVVQSECSILDDQFHCKKLINIFHFLHEDNHQGRLASETTTFGWIWPGVLLIRSDVEFFNQHYLWKKSIKMSVPIYGVSH